jgi:hypothetical protein
MQLALLVVALDRGYAISTVNIADAFQVSQRTAQRWIRRLEDVMALEQFTHKGERLYRLLYWRWQLHPTVRRGYT